MYAFIGCEDPEVPNVLQTDPASESLFTFSIESGREEAGDQAEDPCAEQAVGIAAVVLHHQIDKTADQCTSQ